MKTEDLFRRIHIEVPVYPSCVKIAKKVFGRMEISVLHFCLFVSFILGSQMTNYFFLERSRIYAKVQGLVLALVLSAVLFHQSWLVIIWPFFCVFGFALFLRKSGRLIFSLQGVAMCIPFIFSLISSLWFYAAENDLLLLGYNQNWSLYAALHGAVLGWLFTGALAFLGSRKLSRRSFYLFGCFLCLVLFLMVAFGIDRYTWLKSAGVVGFSIFMPISIGLFTFSLDRKHRPPFYLGLISFVSIFFSMGLAVLNEFWIGFPKATFGMSTMVLTHGLLNVLVTIPCFCFSVLITQSM